MKKPFTNSTKLSQFGQLTNMVCACLASRHRRVTFTLVKSFCIIFAVVFLTDTVASKNTISMGGRAYGDSLAFEPATINPATGEEFYQDEDVMNEVDATPTNTPVNNDNQNFTVQAVLAAKHQIVLASGIDAKISKMDLESGDRFKKGQMLVQYDCSVDNARLNEILSRQRVTEQQLEAYKKLASLDSASKIELVMAQENNEQNKALIAQIRGRLKSCSHVAPWNGRVLRKMANELEYVQNGRVLMEISSLEALRAEFLIPSRWLRWLNIDTPLTIYIGETNRSYGAKIVGIHGEVDPVSQSIQVVAEIDDYHEELLPGMSGRATFTQDTAENGVDTGFLGLNLAKDKTEGTP